MLEFVPVALAFVLALVGVAIIAAPALRTGWVRGRPHRSDAPVTLLLRPQTAKPAGDAGINATTLRALTASARLYGLLRAAGRAAEAAALRESTRQLREDESTGLLALARTLKVLRTVELDDREARARYARGIEELQRSVRDRSEQLELIHLK